MREMKELIHFPETNVDGRTLSTRELTYDLENGALQGVYSDQIAFSNLRDSRSGFQLDMFLVSSEKLWLLDKAGRRAELRKDFSAVSLFRFELAERREHRGRDGLLPVHFGLREECGGGGGGERHL